VKAFQVLFAFLANAMRLTDFLSEGFLVEAFAALLALLADDLRLIESLAGGFSVTAFTEFFLETTLLSRTDEVLMMRAKSLSSVVLVNTVFPATTSLEIGPRSSSITDRARISCGVSDFATSFSDPLSLEVAFFFTADPIRWANSFSKDSHRSCSSRCDSLLET
jgi:hypothetical protein